MNLQTFISNYNTFIQALFPFTHIKNQKQRVLSLSNVVTKYNQHYDNF